MKRKVKRFLSLFLVVVLAIGTMSIGSFAADTSDVIYQFMTEDSDESETGSVMIWALEQYDGNIAENNDSVSKSAAVEKDEGTDDEDNNGEEEANKPKTLAEVGLNVTSHTKQEIRDYAMQYPASLSDNVMYEKEPDTTSGSYTVDSLGVLSQSTQTSALNLMNQIRYIAGLDAVVIDDNRSQAMSAATFLDYLNGELSHEPKRPEGVDDELYNLGLSGAGNSNIAYNYLNLNRAIIGWVEDSDSSNIERLGHRRYILNPTMSVTAFGATGRYYAMYSFSGSPSSSHLTVAWPAQETPIEYYTQNSAWSISIGSNVTASDVTVTVKRNSDDKTWTFSESSSDGYFNVNNTSYGQKGCIIFQPSDISVKSGDIFTVTVEGATENTISYEVEFFNLIVELESISVSGVSKTTYKVGEKLDVTGGEITATYTGNETVQIDLTSDLVSGFSSSSEGVCPVTVTYGGKTTTFNTLIIAQPGELSAEYGQTLSDLTLPTSDYGTFEWVDSSNVPVGNAGETNKFSVIFTPNDGSFSDLAFDVSVKVEKTDPNYTTPTGLTATYGDELSSVALPIAENGTFSWKDSGNTKVGEAGEETFAVIFTPNDTNNYKTVELEVIITVKKAKASTVEVPELNSITYDEKMTLSEIPLPDGWLWDNPSIVPTVGNNGYKATYTPADTKNYDYSDQDLNPTLTLEVKKAVPNYTEPVVDASYGDKLADVELPVLSNGTFSWQDDLSTSVGEVGESSTFLVTFTPDDTNNYEIVSNITATVEVGKATPKYTVPVGLLAIYGDNLSDVELPTTNDGYFVWTDPDQSVGSAGEHIFLATFIPYDNNNYVEVTNIEITVLVEKKKAEPIEIPVLDEITYSPSTTLADVELPSGWTWDEPSIVPTVGNNGYKATYTPSDAQNYDYSEQDLNPTLTVTVLKANPDYEVPGPYTIEDGEKLSDITLPDGYTWQDGSIQVTGETGTTQTYLVNYEPSDLQNYNLVTGIEVNVSIKEKNQETDPGPVEHEYDFGNINWIWAEDYSSVTAYIYCVDGDGAYLEFAANIIESPNADGGYDLIASFTYGGVEYSNVITFDAKGEFEHEHSYNFNNIVWIWADDYSSATAYVYCADNDDAYLSFEANIIEVPNADGGYDLIASFTYDGIEYSDVIKFDAEGEPKHEHTYDFSNIVWVWADDYSSATAYVYCADDDGAYLSFEADIIEVPNADGGYDLIASFTYDGIEYNDVITFDAEGEPTPIPKPGIVGPGPVIWIPNCGSTCTCGSDTCNCGGTCGKSCTCTCDTCTSSSGTTGSTGSTGSTSSTGSTGSTSSTGSTGSTSSTGSTGSTSSTGSTGSTSSTGSTGSTASTGSSGSTTSSVKTADASTPYLYLVIILIAGAAVATVSVRRRITK